MHLLHKNLMIFVYICKNKNHTDAMSDDKDPKILVDTTDDVVRHELRGMYQSWFLDYASYVILERAVPHIDDGLKPCLLYTSDAADEH